MMRISVTLASLVLWATGAVAGAAPKVALTAIDGDVTGNMRDAVAAAIDSDELTVLGEKEVNRAFDKLGDVTELSDKQAKKLSTDLEADALILASYNKKGKAKFLRFKLYVNGKKTRGFKVQFKNENSAKFKQALRDKMIQKIIDEQDATAEDEAPKKKKARLARQDAGEDDEDPNPKAKKKTKKKGQDVDDEATAASEGDAEDDRDEDGDEPRKGKKQTAARDDEELEETAIEKRMEPKHAANRVALRLDTGVSVAGRSLKFTQREGFTQGPRHFKSSPTPGGRFEVELYPFAFGNPQSFIAGLGAAVEYDKTLVLNLQTTAEADAGKKIPVDQQHYAFGPRIRLGLGKKATSPTVTLGFDLGRRKFKADRSKLVEAASLDLPDTNYRFTAPGLGFRLPLGRVLAFVGYGEVMFVSDAGPIQKADSYGKARIVGGSGEAGFDVVFGDRFALRLLGEFTQIGYTFVGVGGELANNRDNDPSTLDVGGAADRSYGGTATLAVMY